MKEILLHKSNRFIILITVAAFVFAFSIIICNAASTDYSGECGAEGDNVTWTLDNQGVLVISGSGDMKDYHINWISSPFNLDSRIKSVIIEPGVTRIGSYAFNGCTNIVNVQIPDTVTSIGSYTFGGCGLLTAVLIPDSVTKIEERAFNGCKGLGSITVPGSVTSMGPGVFSNCGFDTAGPVGSGCDYEFEWTQKIPGAAFHSMDTLQSVILPNTITEIGDSAFNGCTNLNAIDLPDSVSTIGVSAFSDCSGLKEFRIPSGTAKISRWMLKYCTGLTSITIPDTVTEIGEEAFSGCRNLCKVSVSGNVKSLGARAFSGCSFEEAGPVGSNKDFEFGWTESIPPNAFNGCTQLKNIEFPSGVTLIDSHAFWETGLEEVIIPDTVVEIDDYAFAYCNQLTSLRIPASVTELGVYPFRECSGLESAGPYGSGCSYEFGWSKKIPDGAFSYCTGLNRIIIPDEITWISPSLRGCSNLSYIEVSENNTGYTSVDGVLYNKDKTILVCCPARISGSFTIPDTVERINGFAFSYSSVSGVTIPESVNYIDQWAFEYCKELINITIPDSVDTIIGYTFYGCSKLETVNLPQNMTGINDYMFNDCTSLRSIQIPDGVQYIGDRVFNHCSSLEEITIPGSVKRIGEGAFEDCYSLTDVYYGSSEANWNKVEISYNNYCLQEATIHFNSTGNVPIPEDEPDHNAVSGASTSIDALLKTSSVKFNKKLALIAANMSLKAYSDGEKQIESYLKKMGFTAANIHSNNYSTGLKMGSLAFTIATKKLNNSSNTEIMVIVARGSTNWYELFKDSFSLADKKYGKYPVYGVVNDFNNAIMEYYKKYKTPGKNYKILLTGHSLGGASVNLLAAKLNKKWGRRNVYCYTFGAINSIKYPVPVTDGYENIHNIYNNKDTFAPGQHAGALKNGAGSKYGKFGHLETFDHDYRTAADKAADQVFNHKNHNMDRYVAAVKTVYKGRGKSIKFKKHCDEHYKVPQQTTLKKTASGKNMIAVYWEKVSNKTPGGEKGYQIQYSTHKNFRDAKNKSIKSYKTTATSIKDLKGGRTYYVRIRSYIKYRDDKFFSKWSKSRQVTTIYKGSDGKNRRR